MNQDEIKRLLVEACGLGSLVISQQRMEIYETFLAALKRKFARGDRSLNAELLPGFMGLFHRLYFEYLSHRPELILDLLPVFTAMIGEPVAAAGSIFGPIDWDNLAFGAKPEEKQAV